MKKVLVFIVVLGIIGLLAFMIYEDTKHTHYFENGLCECGVINEDHIHKYVDGICKCGSTNDEHKHYYVNGVCVCGKTNGEHVHKYKDGLCECGAINEDHTHKYVDGICKCGAIYEEHVHNYINDICECGAEKPTEGLIFEMIEGGYALVGYEGSAGKIVIPDKYKGIEVVSIKKTAFENWANIYEVSIPNSIKEIEGLPFANCKNLKYNMKGDVSYLGNKENPYLLLCSADLSQFTYSYSIPSGTRFISANAFIHSYDLLSISIPNTVISIGEDAFYNCISLVNVNFESDSQLKSIEDGAFNCCYSIKQISLPDGLEEIGSYAFKSCRNLESIILPNSLKYIGTLVFANCKNLGYNEYNGGYYLGNENNPLLVLASISNDFDNNILSSTKFILEIFSGNTNITEVVWPENMTIIKDYEFQGCTNLTSITIPDSVTSIGEYAFSGCTSLTSIIIPNSITSIAKGIFIDCKNLESITIPDSVANIGDFAFQGCYKLTNVYYNGTIEDWYNLSYDNRSSSNPMRPAEHFYILNESNEYEEVTEITIPNNITSIDNKFYSFNNVKSIIIPESVTSIGYQAFAECDSLISITIPEGVTSIGNYAFEYCSSLTSIIIPESITSIGYRAFYDCSNLSVYYNGTIEDWCNILKDHDSGLFIRHFYMLNESNEYKEVTEITIPNNITSISDYQFKGFTNIETVIIPDSVTSIGHNAFESCTSLTSIIIPDSVTNMGGGVFYYCYDLIVYCEVNSKPSEWSEYWSKNAKNVIWGYNK